jgi:hypothetical protein
MLNSAEAGVRDYGLKLVLISFIHEQARLKETYIIFKDNLNYFGAPLVNKQTKTGVCTLKHVNILICDSNIHFDVEVTGLVFNNFIGTLFRGLYPFKVTTTY